MNLPLSIDPSEAMRVWMSKLISFFLLQYGNTRNKKDVKHTNSMFLITNII